VHPTTARTFVLDVFKIVYEFPTPARYRTAAIPIFPCAFWRGVWNSSPSTYRIDMMKKPEYCMNGFEGVEPLLNLVYTMSSGIGL
jgi:hypothetical protein